MFSMTNEFFFKKVFEFKGRVHIWVYFPFPIMVKCLVIITALEATSSLREAQRLKTENEGHYLLPFPFHSPLKWAVFPGFWRRCLECGGPWLWGLTADPLHSWLPWLQACKFHYNPQIRAFHGCAWTERTSSCPSWSLYIHSQPRSRKSPSLVSALWGNQLLTPTLFYFICIFVFFVVVGSDITI